MDQHPVPQNISSYEFRLVGDMTLKQFFQLAGGIVVAALFYRAPLPGLIKWPIVLLSSITGVLLAFVPVQGRPFSQWLTAFFKAVYSPTKYTWQQASVQPMTTNDNLMTTNAAPPAGPLDKFEAQLFSRITELFNSTTHPSTQTMTTNDYSMTTNAAPITTSQPMTMYDHRMTTNDSPPPPPPPSIQSSSMFAPGPNIVSGIVQTSTGQSIEGVIIEITNTATGLPVRALRSNRLGQFQIATPLPNGNYNLVADKPGLTFSPLTLTTTGQPLESLIIKAAA